ncbi:hypothetical protein BT69DRAFT_1312102 [Atractiella rhizophila]|nr:hypothetical protein BT69DRAFT_1312102 [Atractiella rhizophila]
MSRPPSPANTTIKPSWPSNLSNTAPNRDPGLLAVGGKKLKLKRKAPSASVSGTPGSSADAPIQKSDSSNANFISKPHNVSFGMFGAPGSPVAPKVKVKRMTSSSKSRSRERERDGGQADDERSPLLGSETDLENASVGGSRRSSRRRSNRLSRSSLFGNGKSKSFIEEEERDGRWFTVPRILTGLLGVLIALLVVAVGVVLWTEGQENDGTADQPIFTLPPPSPGTRNPAYLFSGTHGAVSTEVDVCSNIGVEIMREGGNAVDAGIAGTLCVGVVNMFSSGIGGGGFLVIRPPDSASCSTTSNAPNCSQPIAIDFREKAPSGASPMMYSPENWPTLEAAKSASRVGGLAVAVPGELKGLEKAWQMWGGGVSWERVVRPSIELAKGFPTGLELATRLRKRGKTGLSALTPEWRDLLAPNGEFLQPGDICRRPAYANTLERVAKEGSRVFYEGEIAESLVRAIQGATPPGIVTLEDFSNYSVVVSPALTSTYRNRTLYTTHAPGGGPTLVNVLNILENYGDEFVDAGMDGRNAHRFIEAMKFTFAARTEIGDPAFNTSKTAVEMVTKDFGRKKWAKIDDNKTFANISHYDPHYYGVTEDHGTTHISAVDASGLAIAITSTVNLIFGSQVLDPQTGVILNDEMDDFSTPHIPDAFGLYASPYNFPEPGKRPLSSTSPTVVEEADGSFYLVIGGSGGSRIFGGTAQVILNLDWGYDISNAIETPRLHHQLLPNIVTAESGIRADVLHGLRERGHNVTLFDINSGVAEFQAIVRKNNRFFAAADSRKNGIAAAY